jgi:NADH-quinone oxidoreductase subunit E
MLTNESLAQIDREIAKYPAEQKQSAVMSALRIAQQEKGWLAPETLEFLATYLGMPTIAVYEVASFYNMYDLKPVGAHKLTVCTNISCQLQGVDAVVAKIQAKLGIGFGETTADGRFTLKEGECFGACGDGPLCLHNNHTLHTRLTPDNVDAFLEGMK